VSGRRFLSAVIMAAIASTIVAAGAPSAVAAASDFESQFVSKINAERAKKGLSRLSVAGDLVSIGRRHSGRMADKGSIWHNPNLADEVSGNWTVLGENVGMGPTVDNLHAAFMNSPGHRANILDNDWNEMGIGVVVDNKTIYVTEIFAARRHATTTTVTTRAAPASSAAVAPTTSSYSAPARAPKLQPKPKPAPKPRTVKLLAQMAHLD